MFTWRQSYYNPVTTQNKTPAFSRSACRPLAGGGRAPVCVAEPPTVGGCTYLTRRMCPSANMGGNCRRKRAFLASMPPYERKNAYLRGREPTTKKMEATDIITLLSRHGVKPTANRLLVARELDRERRPLSLMEDALQGARAGARGGRQRGRGELRAVPRRPRQRGRRLASSLLL